MNNLHIDDLKNAYDKATQSGTPINNDGLEAILLLLKSKAEEKRGELYAAHDSYEEGYNEGKKIAFDIVAGTMTALIFELDSTAVR